MMEEMMEEEEKIVMEVVLRPEDGLDVIQNSVKAIGCGGRVDDKE